MPSDNDHENPYAPPAHEADAAIGTPLIEELDPVGITRSRLRIPAICLLVLSLLTFATIVVQRIRVGGVFEIGIALNCLLQLLQAYGAVNAMTLRSRRATHNAALIACVPCFSAMVILGIPFGIWMLFELNRPAAKRAYEIVSGKKRPRLNSQ